MGNSNQKQKNCHVCGKTYDLANSKVTSNQQKFDKKKFNLYEHIDPENTNSNSIFKQGKDYYSSPAEYTILRENVTWNAKSVLLEEDNIILSSYTNAGPLKLNVLKIPIVFLIIFMILSFILNSINIDSDLWSFFIEIIFPIIAFALLFATTIITNNRSIDQQTKIRFVIADPIAMRAYYTVGQANKISIFEPLHEKNGEIKSILEIKITKPSNYEILPIKSSYTANFESDIINNEELTVDQITVFRDSEPLFSLVHEGNADSSQPSIKLELHQEADLPLVFAMALIMINDKWTTFPDID